MTALSHRHRAPLAALAVVALAIAVLPPTPPDARGGPRPARPNRAALGTGPLVARSRAVLGGVLDIVGASRATVVDSAPAARAIAAALDEAARLEPVLDPGDSAGELARLNRAADEGYFECSPELFAALDSAWSIAETTDGAWDPTAAPIAQAWVASSAGDAPSPEELSAARAVTGWRLLQLSPERRTARFARPGMGLALEPLDRGYLLERAAGVLRGLGVVRARLALGDVTLAMTSREPWTVRLSCPPGAPGPALRLALSAAACATAAGPVLDPRTARPPTGEATVAVVTRSACRAAALAEALLVMGRDDAAGYVRARADLGALWIEPDGEELRVWAWNLGAVEPEPGLRVVWMTER